jgi:L-ascorbate metabolism protein UlaG (beta-lactamase superfamily)
MAASIQFIWHGLSCFSIEAKNGDAVANLVTDPFGPETGLKTPRNLAADVITVSHEHPSHSYLEAVKAQGEKKIFVIKTPGEYEVGGLFVYGVSAPHDAKEGKERGLTTLYRFEIGDLSVAHLGDLGADILDEQREALEDIDVLLIPVGGESVLNARDAVEIVTQLAPRIVIPMHYALPGLKTKSDPVDKFLKEMGASKAERVAKFKAVKKDLPAEETKVIILEKD